MEADASALFLPPSIQQNQEPLIGGLSYTHYSEVPELLKTDTTTSAEPGTPCVLGVDEAGRGPVIGPMVYGVFYLPIQLQEGLLSSTYHFDDSKVLTPAVRASLMKSVCSHDTDLFKSCGWAINSLSARDIGAGMLKFGGSYNLNAQAMDATIELIRGVLNKGVNVREIYVDTVGNSRVYQQKLERVFPTIKITVEQKADSLYPCVSAASVVAKVTRDVSCETLFEAYASQHGLKSDEQEGLSWGSGYPSDARCTNWLKSVMDPVFGFGSECRFSWGTVKDLLEAKGCPTTQVDWPIEGEEENMRLSQYFTTSTGNGPKSEMDELRNWYGNSVGQDVF